MLSRSGKPYPEKCLVCYTYVNPSNEFACISDTIEYANKISNEMVDAFRKNNKNSIETNIKKFDGVFKHFKSCHATNISRRIWRDFDINLKSTDFETRVFCLSQIHGNLIQFYGVGNFVIIQTSGGYHCLVKIEAMKCDPRKFMDNVQIQCVGFIKEIILTNYGSQFVPVPGTLQYGKLVSVINKNDFS